MYNLCVFLLEVFARLTIILLWRIIIKIFMWRKINLLDSVNLNARTTKTLLLRNEKTLKIL